MAILLVVVAYLRKVLLKVRMIAGLLRRNASSRVVNEHHLQELETCSIKVVAESVVIVTLPLRE